MNGTSTKHVFLDNEGACFSLATQIAKYLHIGDILWLEGPLGSGKTTFVKALVKTMNGDVTQVHSPTYTLMHSYETDMPIIHIDAYRLKAVGDLDGLGFEELREQSISCVEWPSKIGIHNNEAHSWYLRFSHQGEHQRAVDISPPSSIEFNWVA